MTQRLSDIRPGENALGEGVSLVHRGANRRNFLLAKSDEVDGDITEILAEPGKREGALIDAIRKAGGDESVEKAAAAYARVTEALREAFGDDGLPADVVKAMSDQMSADDLDDEDAAEDEGDPSDADIEKAVEREGVFKADFSADERRQMAKSGVAMDDGSYPIPDRDHLEKAVHAVGRGNAPHNEIRAHIAKRARALGATDLLPDSWNVTKEDRMSETAVPVKKEDGSYDLSAVPEDARATVEAVLKERDERETELAEIRKTAEAERTENAERIAKLEETSETAVFIAKAAELEHLAKDDSEFGAVLRAIAKAEREGHVPEGTGEQLDAVLKAADEAVAKGALFAEVGANGGFGSSDAESKVDAAAAELRKSDPKLTKEQAIAKAYENDPSLYDEVRKEQG